MANYGPRGQLTVAVSETIDLNRVRVFTSVVAEGSFTAAARRLGLPKSSVSRSVTTLERTPGVRLLRRTTRALSLTDTGRAYFQQVGPALESVTSSTASVRARGTEPSGRVRISAAPDGAEQLADYVARFRAQYPRVQVDVSFASRHVDLVAEGFDLALRGGFLKGDSSLVMRKLMTTNHVLYAAPAYLRRRRPPKTVAQLKDHDCIGYNSTTGRGVWTLTHDDDSRESVELTFVTTSDLMQFALRAAVGGTGIVMAPEMLGDRLVRARRLVPVLRDWRQPGPSLSIVSPSRTFEPLAVTLFKDGLARAVAAWSVRK